MIYVCDSIMGSGKSMGAIKFMNDNRSKKFIYITPYLNEATRINQSCPSLRFIEPSKSLPDFNFSKTEHTKHLIEQGHNIATTHKAFRMYTSDTLEFIKSQKYTLIIDEAVEVFDKAEYSVGDIQVLIEGGYIELHGDRYVFTGKEYTGTKLSDLFGMLKCNNLIPLEKGTKRRCLYYWMLPIEVLLSFESVYILTYMFDAQDLKCYLDMHNVEYSYIGISKTGSGGYHFTDVAEQIPSHVSDFRSKINIIEHPKLNGLGSRKHDLSVNWFKRREGNTVRELKNGLYNYFRYHNKDVPTENLMWGTYKNHITSIQGRGYTKRHVNFNEKATNKYKDKTVLAYCANVFVRPEKIRYFEKQGIEYDEDAFALSTLVQWIWRSAIREGNEIWVYIPSSRMRGLLQSWLKSENY